MGMGMDPAGADGGGNGDGNGNGGRNGLSIVGGKESGVGNGNGNGTAGVERVAKSGAVRLREMLADKGNMIVAPGVYDGISARLALAAGFECLYMTGAGTSMSRLGMADLGLATLNDMASNAAMLASLNPSVPLIADADTGYGSPIMIARTIAAYSRAGVAALHLEDQVQQKRCGHLLGKEIVDQDVWRARVRAAVQARDRLGSEMLIIARTDARQGHGFEEALGRLRIAVEEGADVVFLEALQGQEECRRVVMEIGDVPVLLNSVPKGVTPDLNVQEARQLGFRIMIFPCVGFEGAMKGMRETMERLKRDGKEDVEGCVGVKEAFRLCGLEECIKIDMEAGGTAFKNI